MKNKDSIDIYEEFDKLQFDQQGTRQAYEMIRMLLNDQDKLLQFTGLRQVIHNDRIAWIKDSDEVEKAFRLKQK